MKIESEDTWHEEYFSDNEKRSYRIKKVLCHQKSNFHEIHIYDLYDKGISLILDGHARVFEIDEFIFHEGFVHSVMARAFEPRSILVLGDGDGGLTSELLKYPEIDNIDWVEIDAEVVECCEKYLPSFSTGYQSEKRVSLHIEDGVDFLKRTKSTYDIVFVSVSVDPEEVYAVPFQNSDIYSLVKPVINKGGLISCSLEEFSPASIERYLERVNSLKDEFDFVLPFSTPLPSFGSNWGFVLASDSEIMKPVNRHPAGLRYYNLNEDDRMFRIPDYLVSKLKPQ